MEKEAEQILKLFENNNISYQLYQHSPVYTSEEAANVRGVELKAGCKSMLLKKKDGKFIIANLAADKKIDMKKLEVILGCKASFASKEEVLKVTNCEAGSVPPFGGIFGLHSFLDSSVKDSCEVSTINAFPML